MITQLEPPPSVVQLFGKTWISWIARLYAYVRERLTTIRISDTVFDDLRFPSQGINPAGSPSAATIDNGADYPGTLLFATTPTQHCAGIAQMPHHWKQGSALLPHIHWSKTTADGSGLDVGWEFRSRMSNIGGTWTAWTAWGAHTLARGDLTTSEKHNLSTFASIDMTGYTLSCLVLWEIRRDVSTDTYGSNARLLEFDFHYEIDSLGSEDEYTKV